jgi:DNA (cytosine-5)-methyltransferase 1
MTLHYLSLCSGIEAATQAWAPLGWVPVAFSEIAPFPSAVLAHHYPQVPNWGDMTRFQEWPDAAVDVLCGGTPCQSFSVAGLRQGLADPRGNLMLTFGAIAGRYRPRWLVWENVPGVLSSNGGRDFGTFLGMLGQLGYGVAYRVLDAQHVRTCRLPRAVPQRRRRVFVVGCLGDWRRAAAVLFDRESLSGHPAPRREAGQRPAPTIGARASGGGGLGTDFDCDGGLIASHETAQKLLAKANSSHRADAESYVAVANSGDVGYCLTASAQQSLDAETETLIAVAPVAGSLCADTHPGAYSGQDAYAGRLVGVAHALRGEGHDASEDGTGRGTPLVPVAYSITPSNSNKDYMARAVTKAQALTAGGGGPSARGGDVVVTIQERAVSENLDAGPGGAGFSTEGAAYTLEARNKVQAVAFDLRGRDGGAMPEGPHDTANIRAASGGSSRSYVAAPWAVRRLTPRECERLQGFPDDFTLVPYRSKPASDGPRYKALGNSWAVNVAEWVGERIAEVDGWEVAA